ncbi:MAG: ABC-F family ATP-binding cassette domain-containing protein [Candidatus Dormibacteraeota bacterium]|uniref:ABC-F family ATP-binding cassette domain-containing protein n=1 Tax=Candidatus Amunia macphersoniae TaxID=3127014 RepID=A0A934KMT6_9BACT|nr:ABC-F family ATP-binding cassette domain-containing protein [Candidatus Dormibacteraeota bacterium]
MPLLSLENVAVAFGVEVVVRGVTLRIEARDRLAVVGANGAGKTSVLGVIAGSLEPREGGVERARDLRIAHLPQDAPEPVGSTVLDEVLASRSDLLAMHAELTRLEAVMGAQPEELDTVLAQYGELQHAYQDAGGYDVEARAREALGGLGIDHSLQSRDPRWLSGGQKRRVELSKLLLADADLLLIDEPTNHLDLASIEWLEEYMGEVRTTFVLVSHDRRFLDRVCTSVLELGNGLAEEYPGNYTQYVRLRAERRARRQKEFDAQQAHVTHQEEFIRKYKAGQRAKEARGRQKQLDRIERVAPPPRERRPRLRFTTAPVSQILLKTSELEVGRGDSLLLRVRPLSIAPGERIAIVGPNGSGKSTLLHTLAGELRPLMGTVTLGPRTRRRLYRQDLGRDGDEQAIAADGYTTDDQRTVMEDLLVDHPVGTERARTMLGALLFSGDDVHKQVGELSGGERARLLLGRVALEETNLLLLDEPTNHLDIPAQEVLESALVGYGGAVVLVTHDRALIDAVATRTWAVEDGTIREVLGGYTDLLRTRERERGEREREAEEKLASAEGSGSRSGTAASVARPSGSGNVRRLEAEIAAAEAELKLARKRLLDPETFADVETGAEAGRAHDRLTGALADLYERWEAVAG